MTSALQDLLERHVTNGTVPGAVASLGKAEPEVAAAGAMSVGGAPMRADAIMRIQSMTKAVLRLRPCAWSRPDASDSTSRCNDGCPNWRIGRC